MLTHTPLRLGSVVAVIVGLLGVSEVLTGTYALPRNEPWPAGLYVADATRGVALAPNMHVRVTRATTFDIATNSAGYRDLEWSPNGRPRVLLAGSAAAFGYGLPRERGIAGQLAELLAHHAEVLSVGIYPYGPPQVLATIRRECHTLKPALVMYLYEYKHTRRDFLMDRLFSSASSEASEQPPRWSLALLALRSWLSSHDLHPRQIFERVYGLDRLSENYINTRYASTAGSSDYDPADARKAARLVVEMHSDAQACGAPFAFVIVPSPYESYYGLREPATSIVLTALEGTGVTVIDTRQGIPRGSHFRIPGLDYPNAAGAAWIATRLESHVRDALATR